MLNQEESSEYDLLSHVKTQKIVSGTSVPRTAYDLMLALLYYYHIDKDAEFDYTEDNCLIVILPNYSVKISYLGSKQMWLLGSRLIKPEAILDEVASQINM